MLLEVETTRAEDVLYLELVLHASWHLVYAKRLNLQSQIYRLPLIYSYSYMHHARLLVPYAMGLDFQTESLRLPLLYICYLVGHVARYPYV
jgi:hypothetical protein